MASGDTLFKLFPGQNEPPAAAFATLSVVNDRLLLAHDDTVNESSQFADLMPQHYTPGASINVYIHAAMLSATSGDVDVDVAFERGNTDINTDSFAAAQSLDNTAVPGTAGLPFVIGPILFTSAQADSIAAGDTFRARFTRDGASDTATGDLLLIAIEGREA